MECAPQHCTTLLHAPHRCISRTASGTAPRGNSQVALPLKHRFVSTPQPHPFFLFFHSDILNHSTSCHPFDPGARRRRCFRLRPRLHGQQQRQRTTNSKMPWIIRSGAQTTSSLQRWTAHWSSRSCPFTRKECKGSKIQGKLRRHNRRWQALKTLLPHPSTRDLLYQRLWTILWYAS